MNLKNTHPSCSDVQLLIEQSVSRNYATANKLKPANIAFKELGLVIKPDGVFKDAKGSIYVLEVFAHTGKLKDGQKKKIATDVLKLAYLRQLYPRCKARILFVDQQCCEHAKKGWIFEGAAQCFGVEFEVVALSDEQKTQLQNTQAIQSAAQKTLSV